MVVSSDVEWEGPTVEDYPRVEKVVKSELVEIFRLVTEEFVLSLKPGSLFIYHFKKGAALEPFELFIIEQKWHLPEFFTWPH